MWFLLSLHEITMWFNFFLHDLLVHIFLCEVNISSNMLKFSINELRYHMNDEFQKKFCYLWIFLQYLMTLNVFYFLRNLTQGTQRNLLRGSQCFSPPPNWVRCWAVDMCPLYLPECTWENSVWYVLVTKITWYLIRLDVFGVCFPQNACIATSRCKSFEKQQFSIYWLTTKNV